MPHIIQAELEVVKKPEVSRTFRAGVGMLIRDDRTGLYLVGAKTDSKLKRFLPAEVGADVIGFPQGGILAGEPIWDAVRRELREEVGVDPAHEPDLDFVARYPKLTAYEMPEEVLKLSSNRAKYGDGQVHRWFVFNWRGSARRLVGMNPGEEFYRLMWLPPEEVLKNAVSFKRDIYRKLLKFAKRVL